MPISGTEAVRLRHFCTTAGAMRPSRCGAARAWATMHRFSGETQPGRTNVRKDQKP